MDRARDPRAARAGVRSPCRRAATAPALGGGALRGFRWAALAASAVITGVACKALSPDFDAIIAIDVSLPDSGKVPVGDTILPQGKALNGRGDSVAAAIVWSGLDSTIQVDSLTGATVGVSAGTGRILARVGNLRSSPAVVTVIGVRDSIAAAGPTIDTVHVSAPDSLSDSLFIRADSAGVPLVGFRIALSFAFPPGGTGVTLVPGDTVVTDGTGIAVFQVRLIGVQPDSAVVNASATSGTGVPAVGSPIKFVVEFVP